ncbi:DUF3558 family protein [Gordonia insulae]|uniref:DUF3558 domain-containing protein n=1 Tax=Gordonia insulae TaxID=2420509 RepID=A0A3G8JKM3_9ACTN|nr:DUF3558 family protein [Gordonia insulae]AZG45631.1 hypothetical protein D7316_02227 [Gordonia insulae]
MTSRSSTIIAGLLVLFTLSACTTTSDTSSETLGPSPVPPVVETPATDPNPTGFSPEQLCETLTPDDVAPLTDGEVTDAPTPTSFRGLPECKWPVENGYGWLKMGVFMPVDANGLLATAARKYPVGDGMGYQLLPGDNGTCKAMVQTPRVPEGYVLSVDVNPSDDMESNLCEKAVPQTEKVLKALGW